MLMALFLRAHERRKDGKVNTYWSLVENRRCADGRVVQRHVLYLGKLTNAQELSWQKAAKQFDGQPDSAPAMPGLASERELQAEEAAAVAVHLHEFRIERARQWGACWVALSIWNLLKLSEFWSSRQRQSVSLSGSIARTSGGTVQIFARPVAGGVWRQVRRAALRFDQHLF